MLTAEMRSSLLTLSTPMLSDARGELGLSETHLDSGIRPLIPYSTMAGTAVTVRLQRERHADPRALTPLIRAYETQSNTCWAIMVIEVPTDLHGYGIFGDGAATMARTHGFVGALVEGGVRDTAELQAAGFPVFNRAIAPASMLGKASVAGVGGTVVVGGQKIKAGDVVVADNDGVIIIRPEEVVDVVTRATTLDAWERAHNKLLAQGKTHAEADRLVGPSVPVKN